jgi:adenine-specific DNA-methyltransferase
VILGRRPDGEKVEGEYPDGRPYSEGFPENAEFFKIDYLDADDVDLGHQFSAIFPSLWLAAGAIGDRPTPKAKDDYLIPKGSHYAILLSETGFRKLRKELETRPDVTHIWIVTDSEYAFAEMRSMLPPHLNASMLYRDYLRNFRINTRQSL